MRLVQICFILGIVGMFVPNGYGLCMMGLGFLSLVMLPLVLINRIATTFEESIKVKYPNYVKK
jgi:hypothetical protein